jgi:hypothetical protein
MKWAKAEFGEEIVFLLVSIATAFIAALGAFALVTVVSAKLVSGEASYGVGLAAAPICALVVGILAFVLTLRKLRSS